VTLPAWLRPWWPAFKRAHLLLSRLGGVVFRAMSPLWGRRGVPTRAGVTSVRTAQQDPAATLHAAAPAVDIEQLTDQVLRSMDQRVIAARERLGKR